MKLFRATWHIMPAMKRIALAIHSGTQRVVNAFDREDVKPATFFFGIALLCYGAEQFHEGLGLALAGCLLVFSVHPLTRWWK